jgi:hypothetical protein
MVVDNFADYMVVDLDIVLVVASLVVASLVVVPCQNLLVAYKLPVLD